MDAGRWRVQDFGVTASDREDAMRLLRTDALGTDEPFRVVEVQENVDVTTLDPDDVLANMGDPTRRGVWFPLGLERPR